MALVERPLYLDVANPEGAGELVREVRTKAGPFAGIVGGAVVGAIAAYFVPKLLDRAMTPILDPRHGENVELELEDE